MFFLKTIVVPSKYFAFAFVKRQNIFVVIQNSIIWRELAPPEVVMVEFCVLIYIPPGCCIPVYGRMRQGYFRITTV